MGAAAFYFIVGIFFGGLGVAMLRFPAFGESLLAKGLPHTFRAGPLPRTFGLGHLGRMRRLIGIGYIGGGTVFIGLGIAAAVGWSQVS